MVLFCSAPLDRKKIISNDSAFEKHKQFYQGAGRYLGLNLWTNYDKLYPERLDGIRSREQALHYIQGMFEEFRVQDNLFYNPLVRVEYF